MISQSSRTLNKSNFDFDNVAGCCVRNMKRGMLNFQFACIVVIFEAIFINHAQERLFKNKELAKV